MNDKISELIEINDGNQSHHTFVYATWLRGYKHSRFANRINNNVYFSRHHAVIAQILARPSTRLVVATLKEKEEGNYPDTILGYLVCEPNVPVVHYCHIKEHFRRMGIGEALVSASKINLATAAYTHRTESLEEPKIYLGNKSWNIWAERLFPGLTYDPYLI